MNIIIRFEEWKGFTGILGDMGQTVGLEQLYCTNLLTGSFALCIYTVSRKKGATGFFAVTFTNIDGFS